MRRLRRERGFTLIEMLVVVALIGILTTIAAVRFQSSPIRAKEAVLKTNLRTLRDVLDQYYADKQRCADSLQTLVDEGYLRAIPIDPFTDSTDWDLEYCEGEDAGLGYLQEQFGDDNSNLGGGPGIWDVHSTSNKVALNGSNYNEW